MATNAYVIDGSFQILKLDGTRFFYYLPEYKSVLRELNRSVGREIFPSVEQEDSRLVFLLSDGGSLAASRCIGETSVSKADLASLATAIETLHAWATNSAVPEEKRRFCRGFRLPDPETMPEAYRITKDGRLRVLWGYEKTDAHTVLPLSKVAQEWDDSGERKNPVLLIKKRNKGQFVRRLFSKTNVALALFAGVLAVPNVRCSVHDCVIGRGLWNYFLIDQRCPARCTLSLTDANGQTSVCNRHLTKAKTCLAHRCKTCGKELPLRLNQGGECDKCFWEIK